MENFAQTHSDAETLAKILGFAFIGALIATNPLLVVFALIALTFTICAAGIVSCINVESVEFDLSTPKQTQTVKVIASQRTFADLCEFIEYRAKIQHSYRTSYGMRRAKVQKLVFA